MSSWLVVGISGVTNGGKSSLTQRLTKCLPPTTKLISQDDYFYPENSKHHTPAPGLPIHHNWEVITSIDTDKMFCDVNKILNQTQLLNTSSNCRNQLRPILLLDGFLLFDDIRIDSLCNFKYFFTLTYEQCLERRLKRCYDPPDIPGYFDTCVWPMYEEHLKRIQMKCSNIIYLDGSLNQEQIFNKVYQDIISASTK